MGIAGSIFELHPPNFQKCVSFEDAQMTLAPYSAISYGFNFGKNAKAFQSILEQSLVYLSCHGCYLCRLKLSKSIISFFFRKTTRFLYTNMGRRFHRKSTHTSIPLCLPIICETLRKIPQKAQKILPKTLCRRSARKGSGYLKIVSLNYDS